MQYYRCKCGSAEAWGSMPPNRCSRCAQCGSSLSTHPDHHREPTPHEFVTHALPDADQPGATETRCRWCQRTRREIEAAEAASNQPPRNYA